MRRVYGIGELRANGGGGLGLLLDLLCEHDRHEHLGAQLSEASGNGCVTAYCGGNQQHGSGEHAECKGGEHTWQRIAGKDAAQYVEYTSRAECLVWLLSPGDQGAYLTMRRVASSNKRGAACKGILAHSYCTQVLIMRN